MAGVGQTYEQVSEGLPLGRRSPRGQLRWYLVRCHEGREQDTCAKVRQIVPAELLQDAFVRRKSFASVRVGEGDGAAAMLTMPLAIVARR